MISIESLRRKLALAAISTVVAAGAITASPAIAATVGIVPPRKPSSDCAGPNAWVNWGIANIDKCRAREGVGPVALPSNWRRLNSVQQMFVLLNLERVNRGLAPIVGLSGPLNGLAKRAATQGTDPSFPSGGFVGGGGIWAAAGSVVGADDSWMYYDGPHGLDFNAACTTPGAPGCWLHRNIILWGGTGGPLVAGGGFSRAPGYRSYAFEILSGYSSSHLTFTWSHELRYFGRQRPHLAPLHGTAAKAGKGKHHKRHHARRHAKRHVRHHARRHVKHRRHRHSGGNLSISFG